MKVYIDSEYRCHITNPEGSLREVENSFFDGKCQEFIEGYRYIPSGESYIGIDGVEYHGITPWKSYSELAISQRKYEKSLLAKYKEELAEYEEELAELDFILLEVQYQNLTGGL